MGPGEMSNEQERDPEGRPQASRQNSVENSGPSGGRGGREPMSPASSPGNLTERYWETRKYEAMMPDMFYPTLLGRWLAEDGTVGISPGELDWLECCSSSLC